jgi:hypothetical protein
MCLLGLEICIRRAVHCYTVAPEQAGRVLAHAMRDRSVLMTFDISTRVEAPLEGALSASAIKRSTFESPSAHMHDAAVGSEVRL